MPARGRTRGTARVDRSTTGGRPADSARRAHWVAARTEAVPSTNRPRKFKFKAMLRPARPRTPARLLSPPDTSGGRGSRAGRGGWPTHCVTASSGYHVGPGGRLAQVGEAGFGVQSSSADSSRPRFRPSACDARSECDRIEGWVAGRQGGQKAGACRGRLRAGGSRRPSHAEVPVKRGREVLPAGGRSSAAAGQGLR